MKTDYQLDEIKTLDWGNSTSIVPNTIWPTKRDWDYIQPNWWNGYTYIMPKTEPKVPMYCEMCGELLEIDDSKTEVRYNKYTGVPYRKGYYMYRCPKYNKGKNKNHTNDMVHCTDSDYGVDITQVTYTSDNTSEG